MIWITFFLAGLLLGSFANVCIIRLPKDEDIFLSRSKCFSCRKNIPWFNNIPVFSYIHLKGRSDCCDKKISLQYPIVEIFMGCLLLLTGAIFSLPQAITISLVFFVVTLIIVIDYYHRIIFDVMNYILIISGVSISLIYPELNPDNISFKSSILTGLIGFGLFFSLKTLFKKIKGIDALGMGDVYLIAGLGVWLGFEKFLYILSISSIIGIFYYLLVDKKSENFEIPYGSALGISFIILILSEKLILQVITLLL